MADTYRQTYTGIGPDESVDDDGVLVNDDELLVNGQDANGHDATPQESRRYSGTPRPSRRVTRSGVRAGWTRAGETLAGKYLVESVRGRSGPEMVVFARHLELDQRVRLRYLLPEASASPEAIARFQRGARKAREMRSEQAERVVDFGRLESGCPYRVTEMPSGPSLEEMLRVRGALAIGEAADIMISVCEPVAEAHAAGIVHRSLCTSSVFVERRADGSQAVKVLDFGVADPLQSDAFQNEGFRAAGPSSLEGPLAYASPEQIRNPTAVNARADVWALGAILYELLTGVRVFEAETQLTLLAMIAADQPAPINWLKPEVPDQLERIVFSCLEKNPDARPRSVVELAVALAPFGSGDAQAIAGRVTRIAMRTTRPPPLPSTGPVSGFGSMRTRAIVRTTAPVPPPVEKPALPSWATMTGGALIGVCAALATALLLRVQLPQPAPAPAPVAAAPVTVVPAPAPSPVETTAVAAGALRPPAAQAPARRIETKPAPKPEAKNEPKAETPGDAAPGAAKRERGAAPAQTVAAGRTTTESKALFSGVN